MKKEEARRAVVSEYDRWAKKHPNDARMMGGFLFFRYLQEEGRTFSISVRLATTNGKSFTAGFGIGWTTDFEKTILLHRLFPGPFRSPRFGLHPVPKTPS